MMGKEAELEVRFFQVESTCVGKKGCAEGTRVGGCLGSLMAQHSMSPSLHRTRSTQKF
jgi:hypothetical protein